MSVETVARRYAGALADVVVKSGEADSVKSELKSWETMMNSESDLYMAFVNPSIAHVGKEKVLESLISKTKSSKTTSNFLRVLLRNSRLTDLKAINERFEGVLAERKGLMTAGVTSARALTDSEKADLRANLAKLTGKTVDLEFTIDEKIISGIITRVGSTVYDSSVKTQLEELRNRLVNR